MGAGGGERLRRLLGHRRTTLVVVSLGVALVLPSLGAGRTGDDYIHQLRLSGDPGVAGLVPGSLDLFVFSSGDPAQRRGQMNEGVFSWWTAPDFRLAFWRPLASLTHVIDHRLLGGDPALMHVHSVIWVALLLLVLARLYHRFHAGWIAGLALLLYAVDDAKGFTVSFLANRNALVAATLGFAAVLLHDRWRRDGWRPGAAAAPATFALALLAGEAALGVVAYLVAHALFLDRGPRARRLGALAPYAVVCLVWLVAHRAQGYGTLGSGIYLDPLGEPGAFLAALPQRLPVLVLSQLAGPPSDLWLFYPAPVATAVLAAAFGTMVAALLLLRPLLRGDPVARFWAGGALLACVPVSATFPSDRLLVFAGVGAMGLVAAFLASRSTGPPAPAEGRPRRIASRIAVVVLVLCHLVVAPALLPLRAMTIRTLETTYARVERLVPRDPSVRDKTLVVVNAPSDGLVCYLPFIRQATGVPRPRHVRLLASGVDPVAVSRLDAHTLRLRPAGGFLRHTVERMVRGAGRPFRLGERVEVEGLRVVVTELTADGRPAAAEFRFAAPLEDAGRFVWMRWDVDRLVPWEPPPPGEETTLPGTDHLTAFCGR